MLVKTQGTKKRLQMYPVSWFDKEKNTELYMYLANIKHCNRDEDFEFFKIQRTYKSHILSSPSVLF